MGKRSRTRVPGLADDVEFSRGPVGLSGSAAAGAVGKSGNGSARHRAFRGVSAAPVAPDTVEKGGFPW